MWINRICHTLNSANFTTSKRMDGNPWGDAWAEVEPQKPTNDNHVSSPPPSADITTNWSDTQPHWGSQSEILQKSQFPSRKETLQPAYESGSYVPWGSPPSVSRELSEETEVPVQDEEAEEQAIKDEIEETVHEEEKEEKIGTWASLGNAAITVGDDAAWGTAWAPSELLPDQPEKIVEEDSTAPFGVPSQFDDEWSAQAQQMTRSDTTVVRARLIAS